MRRSFLIADLDNAAPQPVPLLPELLTLLSAESAAHSQELAIEFPDDTAEPRCVMSALAGTFHIDIAEVRTAEGPLPPPV